MHVTWNGVGPPKVGVFGAQLPGHRIQFPVSLLALNHEADSVSRRSDQLARPHVLRAGLLSSLLRIPNGALLPQTSPSRLTCPMRMRLLSSLRLWPARAFQTHCCDMPGAAFRRPQLAKPRTISCEKTLGAVGIQDWHSGTKVNKNDQTNADFSRIIP